MDENLIGRGLYLVVLGAAAAGALMVQMRGKRSVALQNLSIWALIFVGMIAGFGLWSDISKTVLPVEASYGPTGSITIPQSGDGHYHVTLKVGDVPVRFMIDTGASAVVLTPADAKRVGIDVARLPFTGTATTANGQVATARVMLRDVTLGPVRDASLPAEVNKVGMQSSLLGMTYLQRFRKIEISDGQMILTR